ncbi:hypothetical protein B0G81_7820 [Paraburkholderia sp. BL6665CI2N2]|uniref:hypothetical protein n=1 Tax=Paraburkholderia sp. BL6665CI2N2 TaxID=1938806 RepID=UPI0010647420|nr:hypothetical protein [Paraburkholderia sp. BL6665CI2N2]TDY16725.1 hypothetical protein B0G81_7820 [Paraburkholderia sp. BL6665CI2N2]
MLSIYPESLYYATYIFDFPPVLGSQVPLTGTSPFEYTTPNRPALAMFNNQLWCVYRSGGGKNKLCYCITPPQRTGVGRPWSGEIEIPDQTTVEGPALAVFKDRLYCVYVGTGGDNSLYYTYWSNVNSSWSDAKKFPKHYSAYDPALAVFQGKLWCVYVQNARDDKLHYVTLDDVDAEWSTDEPFSNHFSAAGPALAASKRMLLCVHRGGGTDERLRETTYDYDGNMWSADKLLLTGITHTERSSDGPGLTFREDQSSFVVAYKGAGSDTGVYTATRQTGDKIWTHVTNLFRSRTQAGPALVSYLVELEGENVVQYQYVYRGVAT